MKTISIVTPCFNEVGNVGELYEQVRQVMGTLLNYDYEHIFIDNASSDGTVDVLRQLAAANPRVRVIVNSRNFGQLRSPYHALLQARGAAAILIVADLQDPPSLIREFVAKWEEGYPVVVAVKKRSDEPRWRYAVRGLYYRLLRCLSEVDLIEQFTGFGLYDRRVMDALRTFDEAMPYFRGLVPDVGFDRATVEYTQPLRRKGRTKNNVFSLFDVAMVGLTSHSKAPLRLATMLGFCTSVLSLAVAVVYFVYKLLFWNRFEVGLAPLVIGLFFFASVQLFFLGLIGEYIGAIYTQVRKRPLVIEKERINFDAGRGNSDCA